MFLACRLMQLGDLRWNGCSGDVRFLVSGSPPAQHFRELSLRVLVEAKRSFFWERAPGECSRSSLMLSRASALVQRPTSACTFSPDADV